MNATEIAKALNDGPGLLEFHALRQACEARRSELRALTQNAATREAVALKGLEALEAHDAEQDRHNRELPLLDRIEMAIVEAHEAAITANVRREIPGARKKLPRSLDKVREALAALDAAIADVNETVAVLAQYERLPGGGLPLTDAELSALLEMRDQVWHQRNLAALTPNRETHPKAWALAHVVTPMGDWRAKRPGVWVPDVMPK